MSRKRLPKIEGTIEIEGLIEVVEVFREQYGRPYIYARNDHDLYFAQGFIHAQDRLWQMELNRRAARGKLSEVFGPDALDTDRMARTFGFERLGMESLNLASDEMKDTVDAYLDGVNAFLKDPASRLPLEFSLAGFKPERYTREDCMAFVLLMSWQLSHAWQSELLRYKLYATIGEELAREWEIHYPDHDTAILPEGIDFNIIDPKGILKKMNGPYLKKGKGSNSIVIGGKHTKSGKPIMANDIHLALSAPSLWYEIVLVNTTENRSVRGVSFPGLPVVITGSNNHFAWGITLAFTDAADTYIEKVDSEKNTYEYKGEQKPLTIIEEIIKVKGQQDHAETVRLTHRGPIISEVLETGATAISVQDLVLNPIQTFEGFRLLNEGRSWDDFVEAMKRFTAPQLSIVYIDREDNIGYWCTGTTPIRAAKHTGMVPVPGWTDQYDWQGYVPFEEMPHAYNPSCEYVITANNKPVKDNYPYYLGNTWMNGYRAKRIEDLLLAKIGSGSKVTAEDVNAWFKDVYCIPAVEYREIIRDILTSNQCRQIFSDRENKAIDLFLEWDGRMDVDSVGASVYEVSRYFMVKILLQQKLDPDSIYELLGQGFHPILLPANEYYGHDTTALLRILRNENSAWLKLVGGKEKLLQASFKEAFAWLSGTISNAPFDWQWGKIHIARFPHAFDIKPPLDRIFNPPSHPISGNTDTPYQTAYGADRPFGNNSWSISYRVSVDGADFDHTKAIASLGQSGHLGSKHYNDLTTDWLAGKYHEYHARETLEKNAEGKLLLAPKPHPRFETG